jgi:hypothetical protein
MHSNGAVTLEYLEGLPVDEAIKINNIICELAKEK